MKTHGKSRIPILLNGSVRVTYLRSPFDRVWSFRGRVYGPATKPLTESGTNGWRAECGYKLIPNTSTVSFKELHRVLCRLKRCKRLDSSTFQTRGRRSTWRGKCYEIFVNVTKIVARGCSFNVHGEPIHSIDECILHEVNLNLCLYFTENFLIFPNILHFLRLILYSILIFKISNTI